MKAILSVKYGTPETLKLTEVAIPNLKGNQVLVKVQAASLNYSNLVLLTGKPWLARIAFGVTKPKYRIPGGDMAGTVEAIGEKVTQFKVGDEVFGDLSDSGWGTFAEYVAADEKALALKPRNLSFEESAAVPMAAVTSLQALRDKGNVKTGQEVLIHGASGGVGTYAIQIAKALGATVTAIVSTRNVAIAKSLGADHVIDYKKQNLEELSQNYDLILGVNGGQPLSIYKRKLKDTGTFIHVGGAESQMYQTMLQRPWLSMFGKKKFVSLLMKVEKEDLIAIKELIEAGKVRPIIDKTYTLNEVPHAFQYFQQGHAQGKVVITI
ncbi:NAD(P)-dependent alcohol dehydrogenase [Metabacillus malikii]|uniref:NADPH:quinone reductase-like Zn-dependent oxidoreductase n=1 Tax=Metabacillus malikii TaxID=1504265 RepID=A0ABT9ZPE0_9BACI|nr:NAD(P)-dependent alcohol dehydrogenase [Metabacillus malikii]MDQ0233105.1 NADPH:quinone reductase-like Zn-dependent oxidoreductase [Metabacillus malikii]